MYEKKALNLVKKNFTEVKNGILVRNDDVVVSEEEWRAVKYLCDEWDYSCYTSLKIFNLGQ